MALPREAKELLNAIEAFKAASPQGTPRGVLESLGQIEQQITSVGTSRGGESPGTRAARAVAENATRSGTGEPMERAAKGPDAPSPGQAETAAPADNSGGDARQQAASRVKDFVTAGVKAREYLEQQRAGDPAPTTGS